MVENSIVSIAFASRNFKTIIAFVFRTGSFDSFCHSFDCSLYVNFACFTMLLSFLQVYFNTCCKYPGAETKLAGPVDLKANDYSCVSYSYHSNLH